MKNRIVIVIILFTKITSYLMTSKFEIILLMLLYSIKRRLIIIPLLKGSLFLKRIIHFFFTFPFFMTLSR